MIRVQKEHFTVNLACSKCDKGCISDDELIFQAKNRQVEKKNHNERPLVAMKIVYFFQ